MFCREFAEGQILNKPRFFFVHIMKAGGTSFIHYARNYLGAGRAWRGGGSLSDRFNKLLGSADTHDVVAGNLMSDIFKGEPEIFRYIPHQGACFFDGHMPFVAREALQFNGRLPQCLSILRHPVDRVMSHLFQDALRLTGSLQDPGVLYRNPFWFSAYGDNFQTKLFSMTAEETFVGANPSPEWRAFMDLLVLVVCATSRERQTDAFRQLNSKSDEWGLGRPQQVLVEEWVAQRLERVFPMLAPIEIDNRRFDSAVRGLEQCAVVGVADQLDCMTEELSWRFGWPGYGIQKFNLGREKQPGYTALRKQIARHNEADIELYEYARTLVRKHQQARRRHYSLP